MIWFCFIKCFEWINLSYNCICPDEAIDTFIEKVGAAYEAKVGIKPDFYIAEIGDGACKL